MSSNSTSTATSLPTSSTSASATSSSSFSSSIANSSPSSSATSTSSSSSSSSSFISSSSSTSQTSFSSSSFTSSSSSSFFSSTSSSTPFSSSTQSSSTTSTTPLSTSIILPTSSGESTVTSVVTETQSSDSITPTSSSTSSSASATGTAGLITSAKSTSSGLGTGGTIAVAVVVPIVAVALIVLAGLWFWRKRKARKDAEELRRKEVEEYGYNPNNDPTLPAVGAAGSDGPFEMREDGSAGYRGWGTTAVASSGRKASTTLSGGASNNIGMAYSEGTSPTHGPVSDTRSDNPLVDGRPISGEVEALGAMGPATGTNRNGEINRGPSNASSSYSAANRSDGSGEGGVPGGGYYNNQYDTGNPYNETQYGSPPGGRAEMGGQPVIRDVQARRNTRIENPSHFPQQSAGISQNF